MKSSIPQRSDAVYPFFRNVDHGTECILNQFDGHTKLHGAVDMLKGRDAIGGGREFHRLEVWVDASLIYFNKSKGKVLHMGQGNPPENIW